MNRSLRNVLALVYATSAVACSGGAEDGSVVSTGAVTPAVAAPPPQGVVRQPHQHAGHIQQRRTENAPLDAAAMHHSGGAYAARTSRRSAEAVEGGTDATVKLHMLAVWLMSDSLVQQLIALDTMLKRLSQDVAVRSRLELTPTQD